MEMARRSRNGARGGEGVCGGGTAGTERNGWIRSAENLASRLFVDFRRVTLVSMACPLHRPEHVQKSRWDSVTEVWPGTKSRGEGGKE